MKTSVSIPKRRTKKSRSQLFSDAVKDVARHALKDAMDRVCTELGNSKDDFVASAARRILERSEW
jgi:metal-responsive CopG/Arc/MetJ family transcriptional regulator